MPAETGDGSIIINESQELETAAQQLMDVELSDNNLKEEPAGSAADSESFEQTDMSSALDSTLPGNFFILCLSVLLTLTINLFLNEYCHVSTS